VMVQEVEVAIGAIEVQGMEITREVIGMLHVVVPGMTQEETQGVTEEETQEEKIGEIGGAVTCVVVICAVVTCAVVIEISDKKLVEGMSDGVVIIEME